MVVHNKGEFSGGGAFHGVGRQEDPDPGVSGRVKWHILGEDWGGVAGIRCGGGVGELEETCDGAVRVSDDLEVVVGINGGDWDCVLVLIGTRHGDWRLWSGMRI